MKYRKRPVVIEAMEPLTIDNYEEIAAWCDGGVGFPRPIIYISTLEGLMLADAGDYVIKGVQSEFYPCKPEIFAETYEAVEE